MLGFSPLSADPLASLPDVGHPIGVLAATIPPPTAVIVGNAINPVVGDLAGVVPVYAGLDAAHGVAGMGFGVLAAPAAGIAASHGVRGGFDASVSISSQMAGVVVRYETRGQVRLGGVLVNRRVRAYRRSDGVLLGQADTVGGYFRVHCGFAADEVYLVPVDMSAEAVDYAPPCANRVTAVIADDMATI